jgi:hypothetical protein
MICLDKIEGRIEEGEGSRKTKTSSPSSLLHSASCLSC